MHSNRTSTTKGDHFDINNPSALDLGLQGLFGFAMIGASCLIVRGLLVQDNGEMWSEVVNGEAGSALYFSIASAPLGFGAMLLLHPCWFLLRAKPHVPLRFRCAIGAALITFSIPLWVCSIGGLVRSASPVASPIFVASVILAMFSLVLTLGGFLLVRDRKLKKEHDE